MAAQIRPPLAVESRSYLRSGTPGGIRTPDPRFRRSLLCVHRRPPASVRATIRRLTFRERPHSSALVHPGCCQRCCQRLVTSNPRSPPCRRQPPLSWARRAATYPPTRRQRPARPRRRAPAHGRVHRRPPRSILATLPPAETRSGCSRSGRSMALADALRTRETPSRERLTGGQRTARYP